MSDGERIPTDGGAPLGQNPFGGLSGAGLPAAAAAGGKPRATVNTTSVPMAAKNRGRVDITRQTAGRGGKTVTIVSGFAGIGQPEKEQLAKKIQKSCGAGGTVKDGCIEIQGDKRDQAAKILAEAGFRPVFAGGGFGCAKT
jgi:translation initiation factor 1